MTRNLKKLCRLFLLHLQLMKAEANRYQLVHHFSNAKSISSTQVFGDQNKSADLESTSTLAVTLSCLTLVVISPYDVWFDLDMLLTGEERFMVIFTWGKCKKNDH